jgi:hypothetical protein
MVCEENDYGTNIQLYEIKQRSFASNVLLQNVTAITS